MSVIDSQSNSKGRSRTRSVDADIIFGDAGAMDKPISKTTATPAEDKPAKTEKLHPDTMRDMPKNSLSPLKKIESRLPEKLVDCITMCFRNAVTFEFYNATFDWLKAMAFESLPSDQVELVAQCAINALETQAIKGTDPQDLELMQIAAELLITELDEKYGFDVDGIYLSATQEISADELAASQGDRVALTKLADVLSLARWDAIIKLVDVLIEVTGKKLEQQYETDLSAWQSQIDELEKSLKEAEKSLEDKEQEAQVQEYAVANAKKRLEEAALIEKQRDDLNDQLAEISHIEQTISEKRKQKDKLASEKASLQNDLNDLEDELSRLGTFAFGQKKELRNTIDKNQESQRELDKTIEKLESDIFSLCEIAEQRASIESRLDELPADSRVQLKADIDLERQRLSQAENAIKTATKNRDNCNSLISEHKKKKPMSSSYSPAKAKKELQWRPKPPRIAKKNTLARKSTPPRKSHGSSSSYKRGASSWRNRRPSFSDTNPIHMRGTSSSGFSNGEYRATVGYEWNIDDPDMTHRLDIDIEGPSDAFEGANKLLADISQAFKLRYYSGKFRFLKDVKCRKLPYNSIDTRLHVPKLSPEEVGAATGMLGAICNSFPELKIDGVIEMTTSYAGIRNVYYVTSRAGSSTLNMEQKVEGLR